MGLKEEKIQHPILNFQNNGGEIGLLGDFDSISFYNYKNASGLLNDGNSSKESGHRLYVRNVTSNQNVEVGSLDGYVSQMIPLSNDSVAIHGNFTLFNEKKVVGPIIYNATSNNVTSIFASSSSGTGDGSKFKVGSKLQGKSRHGSEAKLESGKVNTIFVDHDLIYMGGNFDFNNTYGAAVYNVTSKEVSSMPFQGFGKNSTVNSIIKTQDEKDNVGKGSIIFGGHFDTLGVPELLKHNVSKKINRSTLVTAEQQVPLKHAIFSNTNGANNDESSIICPSESDVWSIEPNKGGQWAAELPDEMKGLRPTKIRLFPADQENNVKTFRIYTYPNNGIMNLSYVDPSTNKISLCDALCTLLRVDDLKNFTQKNSDDLEKFDSDPNVYVDSNDGSYMTYVNALNNSKTLGYGANYQEFALENPVGIDKFGITVIEWYGSQGALAGVELYLNTIIVYGNNTLNEPNCADSNDEDHQNYSEIKGGKWKSIKSLVSRPLDNDYLVSVLSEDQDSKAEIYLYPNITYSGNYSIILPTPGCVKDDSCEKRSIVNVTLYDYDDNVLASKLIYQNNNDDKFDSLFEGHLNGTEEDKGRNKISISYYDDILPGQIASWVIVDKVTTMVVGLDDHSFTQKHNKTKHTLEEVKINGLFEYSLANFSNYQMDLVYKNASDNKKIVESTNTYVGNSSINTLSAFLGKNALLEDIDIIQEGHDKYLVLFGDHISTWSNITNNEKNFVTFSLSNYNNTANETEGQIFKRYNEEKSSLNLFNGSFDESVMRLVNHGDDLLLIGNFSMENDDDSSLDIENILDKNSSISDLSNFALLSNNIWYGFGNEHLDESFDQFANISIDGTEYFVFGSTKSNLYKVWNHTATSWVDDPKYVINITQAVNLDPEIQIVSGMSFNVMDFYSRDQAVLKSANKFKQYNFTIDDGDSEIELSIYYNRSLSIINGNFTTDSDVRNIGLIQNDTIKAVDGEIEFSNAPSMRNIYANLDILIIGSNDSISVNGEDGLTGILVYYLSNNSFADTQPPSLSNNGHTLHINSVALYDKDNTIMVGGNFKKAGSLDCNALCIYNLKQTQWQNPDSDDNVDIDGYVTNIKFYTSSDVLISGNLTFNGERTNFMSYSFGNSKFKSQSKAKINTLDSNLIVNNFILTDNKTNLDGRAIAYGSNFIAGFDGSSWNRIDEAIDFSSEAEFKDMTLLTLDKENGKSNGSYFDKNKVLSLAGRFKLKHYGMVNIALFDGTTWIPYVYTAKQNEIGIINSILLRDSLKLQSLTDILNRLHDLSRGNVVGISLACALGSTLLFGALYMIPFFVMMRKSRKDVESQRIQENEMLQAVNPGDLLHEIDLNRHS